MSGGNFKKFAAAANKRTAAERAAAGVKDKRQANKGRELEKALERRHGSYRGRIINRELHGSNGVVMIKVPTDVVPGGVDANGRPIFRKAKRVVDFLGALDDGEAMAIEAKEVTGSGRFSFSRVTPGQIEFMRGWKGVGLLILSFVSDRSVWAVPFGRFLRDFDGGGPRSWRIPTHKACVHREPSLADIGCRLSGHDWFRALREGRLDHALTLSE